MPKIIKKSIRIKKSMYDTFYNSTERGKLVAKRREIRHAIPRLEKFIERLKTRIDFYKKELENLDAQWEEMKRDCPKPRFSGQHARRISGGTYCPKEKVS